MSTDTSTDNPEKSRQGYIAAQLSDEAKRLGRRGWVIGAFFDRDDPNYCTDLEVKFGQYRAGENPKHPAKISQTTEWTMILAGAVRAWVDGDQVTLHAGDYILIRPGIPNNTLVEVLEDVTVLTVKAPSDPSAKTILAGTAHPVHDDGGRACEHNHQRLWPPPRMWVRRTSNRVIEGSIRFRQRLSVLTSTIAVKEGVRKMAMAHLASMWGFGLAAVSLVLPLIFLIAQGRTSIPVVLLSALLASFIVIATSTDLFVIAENAPRESRLGYLGHSVVDSPTLSLIAAAAIAAWLGTLIAAINRARATTESKPDDHS